MGKPKKEKKDPFADLPESFKDEVASSLDAAKAKLAEVAKMEEKNQSEKKANPDINSLKAKLKIETSPYTEVSKMNKLKTKYIIQRMADQGDNVAQSIVQDDLSAEAQKSIG